jgi:hypothetical protein
MKNLEGPCQNCGRPLGKHSRRGLRACQLAPLAFVRDVAAVAGIMWFMGKLVLNPKGLEEDIKKISATYTDGIKALQGEEK